jgi:uncharacterized protein
MKWVIDGNEEAFADFKDILDPDACRDVIRRSRAALDGLHPLLESRRLERRARKCHGHLHLSNIVLLDGLPILFDASSSTTAFRAWTCCTTSRS